MDEAAMQRDTAARQGRAQKQFLQLADDIAQHATPASSLDLTDPTFLWAAAAVLVVVAVATPEFRACVRRTFVSLLRWAARSALQLSDTLSDEQPAAETLTSEAQLRALYGTPMQRVTAKVLGSLDEHCCKFISLSPFLVLASGGGRFGAHSSQGLDCSPRGAALLEHTASAGLMRGECVTSLDAPGFVRVLQGGSAIAIPDRPGNNRLDTMINLCSGSRAVGVIFFVPGLCELLRVNGVAHISTGGDGHYSLLGIAPSDRRLLESLRHVHPSTGRPARLPKAAIIVTVREAMLHCTKALTRSRLWQDDSKQTRKAFPALPEVIREHIIRNGVTLEPGVAIAEDGTINVAQYTQLCEESLKPENLW